MALIEISRLNGQAGNRDFWQESRIAETAVLQVTSRLLQIDFKPTDGQGAHSYDFVCENGCVGDVKIWSGSEITLELTQRRGSKIMDGWFESYRQLPNFAGLLTVNHAPSAYHKTHVFKLRWTSWPTLTGWADHNRHKVKGNSRGTYLRVNPMEIDHWWLGDFLSTPSALGPGHLAFSTHQFVANPRLNLSTLRQLFLQKFDTV